MNTIVPPKHVVLSNLNVMTTVAVLTNPGAVTVTLTARTVVTRITARSLGILARVLRSVTSTLTLSVSTLANVSISPGNVTVIQTVLTARTKGTNQIVFTIALRTISSVPTMCAFPKPCIATTLTTVRTGRTNRTAKSGCLNGFHDQTCSDVCQHCVNNTCQKDDGVCVHGCILGYRLDVSVQKCVYGNVNIRIRHIGVIARYFDWLFSISFNCLTLDHE
ncbi:hypothetical protein DPMN_132521 [Dreissena polymorpha]|uniref:Uncharacterized protein n=1 Tax=Dreissena polymorpha TaxID=45954 RepID=A0A9D4FVA6_DREPO|nr:hypothetical protein DPMN_132521 [Dreissena polymorpha]